MHHKRDYMQLLMYLKVVAPKYTFSESCFSHFIYMYAVTGTKVFEVYKIDRYADDHQRHYVTLLVILLLILGTFSLSTKIFY